MKGYHKPYLAPREPEPTNMLVGCKRCSNSWYEQMLWSPDAPRINSAMRIYDFCNKCITDAEKETYEPHSR